jgi:hypothetical protein
MTGRAGEPSVVSARLKVTPDNPVELAEEVRIVIRAQGRGPVFGHRRLGW